MMAISSVGSRVARRAATLMPAAPPPAMTMLWWVVMGYSGRFFEAV